MALVNAPRRTAQADAGPALEMLLKCGGSKKLVKGNHPQTALLHAVRAPVAAELDRARRTVQGPRQHRADPLRLALPAHPLVAQAWRGRLKDKIVLAANTGRPPGWVHFAARTATGTDLIPFLADYRSPGSGAEYGSGHVQATGGALRPADWNAFAARNQLSRGTGARCMNASCGWAFPSR